jgi:hypothetical protein
VGVDSGWNGGVESRWNGGVDDRTVRSCVEAGVTCVTIGRIGRAAACSGQTESHEKE